MAFATLATTILKPYLLLVSSVADVTLGNFWVKVKEIC